MYFESAAFVAQRNDVAIKGVYFLDPFFTFEKRTKPRNKEQVARKDR